MSYSRRQTNRQKQRQNLLGGWNKEMQTTGRDGGGGEWRAKSNACVPGVWYCCRRTSTGSTGWDDADTPLPEDRAIFAGSIGGACFHGDLRLLQSPISTSSDTHRHRPVFQANLEPIIHIHPGLAATTAVLVEKDDYRLTIETFYVPTR